MSGSNPDRKDCNSTDPGRSQGLQQTYITIPDQDLDPAIKNLWM